MEGWTGGGGLTHAFPVSIVPPGHWQLLPATIIPGFLQTHKNPDIIWPLIEQRQT